MSLHATRSSRKLSKPVIPTLAIVALFIAAVPSVAATPQPQPAPPLQSPNAPNAQTAPDATCPAGGQCFADVPAGNSFYTFVNRIYMQDLVTGYPCGGAGEPCDAENRPYYRPVANVTRQQMAKFIDNARRLPQIDISVISGTAPISVSNGAGIAISASSNLLAGVYGHSTSGTGVVGSSTSSTGVSGSSGSGIGVRGTSTSSYGVLGQSTSDDGVLGLSDSDDGVHGITVSGNGAYGHSTSGYGVYGSSDNDDGVHGITSAGNGVFGSSVYGAGVYGNSRSGSAVYGHSDDGVGVYGSSNSSWAGSFAGDIYVSGSCTGCAGPSKIDHPLDPQNKYLYHSTVQSPDMKTIYDGNVTTDDKGEAEVVLPDYFEALNRDFRYQLTIMGDQFAQARVSSEIKDNRFTLKTDKPNVKVSWQVTGIRQDPYANAHRIPVEEDKPADEKGKYLHPTEWGQPESAGIDYEQQQKMQEVPQANETKP